MNKKRVMLAVVAALALAMMVVLPACSCSQEPASRSKETFAEPESQSSVVESSVDTEPFYVLLIGDDTRTGTSEITKEQYADGNARSDTMMLARVDAGNHKIALITVPRDTRAVQVNGTVCKLNWIYQYENIDSLMDNIADLTGVKPKYYLDTTFVGFEDAVNALGGVDVNVPVGFTMADIVSGEDVTVPEGEQSLDGAQALALARQRHLYGDMGSSVQEAVRQTNDRAIMQSIITEVMAQGDDAEALARSLFTFVKSNWDVDDFAAYVSDFAEHADEVTFVSGTGPYDGDFDPEANGDWLAYRDTDTWAKIIETVEAGGDPNDVLPAPTI